MICIEADLGSDEDEALTSTDDFVTIMGQTVLLNLGAATGETAGVDVGATVVGKGGEPVAGDFAAIA